MKAQIHAKILILALAISIPWDLSWSYQPALSAKSDEIYYKYVLKQPYPVEESTEQEPETSTEHPILETSFSNLAQKVTVPNQSQKKSFFEKVDIKASAKILDASVGGAFGISLGWKYEVEPTYSGRYYTRIDSWKPKIDLRVGDIVSAGPVFFDVSAETEFLFVRQFQSQSQAAFDGVIYDLENDLPISAEKALKMQPGDLVIMPMRKNLITGVGLAPLQVYQMVSGEFQVQVMRLNESKVRLRLVSGSGYATGTSIAASVDLEIFNLRVVDWITKKILGQKIVDFRVERNSGQIFLVDYIMDLQDTEVQKAYNSIVNSPLKIDNWVHDNSWNPASFESKTMVSDLTALEQLMSQDKDKPTHQQRIIRMFKGKSEYSGQSASNRLGMKGMYYKSEESLKTQKIVFFDSKDNQKNALAESYRRKNDLNIFWGFWRSVGEFAVSSVVQTDSEGNFLEKPSYVFQQEYKEKTMNTEEISEYLNLASIWTTPQIKKDLKMDDLSVSPMLSNSLNNARFFQRFILSESVLPRFTDLDLRLMARHYQTFLQKIRLPKQGAYLKEQYISTGQTYRQEKEWRKLQKLLENQPKWIQANYRDMTSMLEQLVEVYKPQTTESERMKILTKLGSNKVYRQTGVGFILYLSEVSQGVLQSHQYRADFKLGSSDGEILNSSSGQSDKVSFIEAMEFIQNLIERGAYDFRVDNFGLQP